VSSHLAVAEDISLNVEGSAMPTVKIDTMIVRLVKEIVSMLSCAAQYQVK
jgi:hypothetical protein